MKSLLYWKFQFCNQYLQGLAWTFFLLYNLSNQVSEHSMYYFLVEKSFYWFLAILKTVPIKDSWPQCTILAHIFNAPPERDVLSRRKVCLIKKLISTTVKEQSQNLLPWYQGFQDSDWQNVATKHRSFEVAWSHISSTKILFLGLWYWTSYFKPSVNCPISRMVTKTVPPSQCAGRMEQIQCVKVLNT